MRSLGAANGPATALRAPGKPVPRQGGGGMLVLTRKVHQSIMIGDDVELSVQSITGDKVSIGIQAPRNIPVYRNELYLEIQQQKLAAGTSGRAEVNEALERLSAHNSR
jgi:carbon storage regulator